MNTVWVWLLDSRLGRIVLPVGVVVLILLISQSIYRLYFHPLSGFPGPRSAALSTIWLHRVSNTGNQEQIFERLHKEYGTSALRIGPNELHITDISLHKTIYRQSHPFPKDPSFYEAFLQPHSVFQELDLEAHKERRRLLSPYFSRAGTLKIEHMIQKHVNNLRDKFRRLSQQGIPIDMHNASRCGTVDIITEFAFGKSRHLVQNSDDQFRAPFLAIFDVASTGIWNLIYLPLYRIILESTPQSLVNFLSKDMKILLDFVGEGGQYYMEYKNARRTREKETTDDDGNPSIPTIFDSLAHLPDKDVITEASDIFLAGSETTAFTLFTAIRHICANPAIQAKLTTILREAFPSSSSSPSTEPHPPTPALLQLESIPYLRACINESLRLAMPVRGRLPRIVPPNETNLSIPDTGRLIPPGTTVGMSAHTMHLSADIWGPDALTFNPDRWMDDDDDDNNETKMKEMEGNLVTFSRGARSCLGRNLAVGELFLMVFMVFWGFDVEVVNKREEDDDGDDNEEDGKVEMGDFFMTVLRGGGRVWVKLVERGD